MAGRERSHSHYDDEPVDPNSDFGMFDFDVATWETAPGPDDDFDDDDDDAFDDVNYTEVDARGRTRSKTFYAEDDPGVVGGQVRAHSLDDAAMVSRDSFEIHHQALGGTYCSPLVQAAAAPRQRDDTSPSTSSRTPSPPLPFPGLTPDNPRRRTFPLSQASPPVTQLVIDNDTSRQDRHGKLKPNELKALEQGLNDASLALRYRHDSLSEADSLNGLTQSPAASSAIKHVAHGKNLKFKILMLGDSAVGKTSLINRFVEDKFAHTLVGTVGVDFKMKRMWLGPMKEMCSVQIWDTAGQERFHRITKTYYRNANAIYLTFDCSSQESLDNLEYWVQNIKDNAANDILVLLVANKIDLRETEGPEKVAEIASIVARGEAIARQYGAKFFRTSAKTGAGVDASFTELAELVYTRLMRPMEPLEGVDPFAEYEKRGRGRVRRRIRGKRQRDCAIQ